MVPLLLLALLLAARPALGETIYKCTVAGSITYGDQPCADGVALEVPAVPAADPATARRLQAQKSLLAQMERERGKRDRAGVRTSRAAASALRRCAKLQLQQKWADEAVDSAMSEQREVLRRKAQRHRQTMAIECPG